MGHVERDVQLYIITINLSGVGEKNDAENQRKTNYARS